MTTPARSSSWLDDLLRQVSARAAGCWELDGAFLRQRSFTAAVDMDPAVADGFASATQAVALDQLALGIVKAYHEGQPAISRREELPADVGSGLWLRRFEAHRSVAVPIPGHDGQIRWVVSVALGGPPPDDAAIVESVRKAAEMRLAGS